MGVIHRGWLRGPVGSMERMSRFWSACRQHAACLHGALALLYVAACSGMWGQRAVGRSACPAVTLA